MHPEALHFLQYVYQNFKQFYKGKVLDVGSGDINGNNRAYFENCDYWGCDVVEGPNVDIVSPVHLLPFAKNTFDMVISSECFEHDMHYEQSLKKIESMVKDGGLFVFTCASTGRPEHGTLRTSPGDSLSTRLGDQTWGNYYKNITHEDVLKVLDMNKWGYSRFYFNAKSCDLYFVGIKGPVQTTVPNYTG